MRELNDRVHLNLPYSETHTPIEKSTMANITVQGKEWLGPANPTSEPFGAGHLPVSTLDGRLRGYDDPSVTYKTGGAPPSVGSRHRPGG